MFWNEIKIGQRLPLKTRKKTSDGFLIKGLFSRRLTESMEREILMTVTMVLTRTGIRSGASWHLFVCV